MEACDEKCPLLISVKEESTPSLDPVDYRNEDTADIKTEPGEIAVNYLLDSSSISTYSANQTAGIDSIKLEKHIFPSALSNEMCSQEGTSKGSGYAFSQIKTELAANTDDPCSDDIDIAVSTVPGSRKRKLDNFSNKKQNNQLEANNDAEITDHFAKLLNQPKVKLETIDTEREIHHGVSDETYTPHVMDGTDSYSDSGDSSANPDMDGDDYELKDDSLTEDDVAGASLGGRAPEKLTVPQLRFWLSCRGLKSTKMVNKAALVDRVNQVLTDGKHYPIIDPSPDKQHPRKQHMCADYQHQMEEGLDSNPVMQSSTTSAQIDGSKKKGFFDPRAPNAIPNNPELIKSVQEALYRENPQYGFCNMVTPDNEKTEYVKTKLGTLVPRGSMLSYQLAADDEYIVEYAIDYSALQCNDECDPEEPHLPLNLQDAVPYVPDSSLPQPVQDFVSKSFVDSNTPDYSQSTLYCDIIKARLMASNFREIINCKSQDVDKYVAKHKKITAGNLRLTKAIKYEFDSACMALVKYAEYMNNIIGYNFELFDCGFVTRPDMPFLGCLAVGKITDLKYHPHHGIVEVKCPYRYKSLTVTEAAQIEHKDSCLEITNGKAQLKRSHAYYNEVQGQMVICNVPWCDFVVYTEKGLFVERISADDDFQSNMIKKLTKFYFQKFVPALLK